MRFVDVDLLVTTFITSRVKEREKNLSKACFENKSCRVYTMYDENIYYVRIRVCIDW